MTLQTIVRTKLYSLYEKCQ